MSTFARPFRITDGTTEGQAIHGTQFPDGRCVLALPSGGFHVSIGFEHLELPEGAVVEWADGGDQP